MEVQHSNLIRQAVQRARLGKPQEALELLLGSRVPQDSPHAAHYYHTLGSLLLDQGRVTEAFAYLDVAHHRARDNAFLESTWKRAQKAVDDRLGAFALNRASTPIEKWVDHPVSLPLEALLAVSALVFSLSCFRPRITPRSKTIKLRLAMTFWFLALSATGLHYWGARYDRGRASKTLTLRSGPADDFLELQQVEAGSELRALERGKGWVRVRVRENTSGWVPEDHVLLFRPLSTTREL